MVLHFLTYFKTKYIQTVNNVKIQTMPILICVKKQLLFSMKNLSSLAMHAIKKEYRHFTHKKLLKLLYLQKHPDLHVFCYDQFSAFTRKGTTKYLLVLDLPLNLLKSEF